MPVMQMTVSGSDKEVRGMLTIQRLGRRLALWLALVGLLSSGCDQPWSWDDLPVNPAADLGQLGELGDLAGGGGWGGGQPGSGGLQSGGWAGALGGLTGATNSSGGGPIAGGDPIAGGGPTYGRTLSVYFFDVGQGNATLLAGPDFTILVDAGRHDRSDVVPHLASVGVRKIDLLIGSHPHADHIGQFAPVLQRYPVTEVWMSGHQTNTRTFERAIDAVIAAGAGYHEPRSGEAFMVGSARVEVLNPIDLNGDFHHGCVAIRVVYGQVAFMITGDMEVPMEQRILRSGMPVRSQILQLGHHGSTTSTSVEFLRAVQPEVAIYSAGVGNTYGHPHQPVLDRVTQHGVRLFGTDRQGTIVVTTDGQRYDVVSQFDPRLATGAGQSGGR
jgi:competence protein ComEC